MIMEQFVWSSHGRLKNKSSFLTYTQTVEGFNVGPTTMKCAHYYKNEA